jgi:hypothetical protein
MDTHGIKTTQAIAKGELVVAICGELLTLDEAAKKNTVGMQRVIIPGQLVLDASADTNSRGGHIPDHFKVKDYNIRFDINRPTTPDCLLGYATRNLKKDEYLFASRGKEYWVQRSAYNGLSLVNQAACNSKYKMSSEDLI